MPDPTKIVYPDPVFTGEITDSENYYKQHSGVSLVFTIFDPGNDRDLVARGQGMQWNEQYQLYAEPEWGQRRVIEIVEGAMLAGQINFRTMMFFHLQDNMPTYRELGKSEYLECMVQIASHEKAALKGLVLDVFRGVKFQGQQGQWDANSKYLRNGTMWYMERLKPLEWLEENPDYGNATDEHGPYPAAIGG